MRKGAGEWPVEKSERKAEQQKQNKDEYTNLGKWRLQLPIRSKLNIRLEPRFQGRTRSVQRTNKGRLLGPVRFGSVWFDRARATEHVRNSKASLSLSLRLLARTYKSKEREPHALERYEVGGAAKASIYEWPDLNVSTGSEGSNRSTSHEPTTISTEEGKGTEVAISPIR
jgi:hypothetical protein